MTMNIYKVNNNININNSLNQLMMMMMNHSQIIELDTNRINTGGSWISVWGQVEEPLYQGAATRRRRGRGSREGAVPLPRIFFGFLPRNGAFCVHSDIWLDSLQRPY